MTLVILAAGMGSRFGGLKQIEPIDKNGNFIIDYSIYDAIREGFDKVVFVIKEENYDIFRETIGKRIEGKIKVEYAFQKIDDIPEGFKVPEGRIKPWGTGQAILCTKKYVNDDFIIINADDFYGRDAFHVAAEYIKNKNSNKEEYAIIGYKVENTLTENGSVKRGVCETKDGYLTKIVESKIEKKDNQIIATPLENGEEFIASPDDTVSMNMICFTQGLYNYLEVSYKEFFNKHKDDLNTCEFLIPSVIFEEIEKGIAEVKVLKTNAIWHGVTYREDKEDVVNSIQKLIDNKEYPEKLWN